MSRVDIINIVKQVSIDNELYAEKYSVTLAVDAPFDNLFVNADALRLKQVLTNLVSNAAKFSFPNGAVIIRISSEKSSCTISVIDNGHGISAEFSKRIFTPFSQQADHLTRNSGGSGLGLAISKNLIEIMSGEIGYQSKPNVETAFWVKLPIVS